MYTKKDLNERLIACTMGYTHKNYDRVNHLREFYHSIATGQTQDGILMQYGDRETEEELQQRINVTHSATKGAYGSLEKAFNRVYRVDKPKLETSHTTEGYSSSLNAVLGGYGVDGSPLLTWLNTQYLYYNGVDPNAWHLVSYHNEDVYPYCVDSSVVVDFETYKGTTQYLICKHYNYDKDGKQFEMYIGYEAGRQLSYIEHYPGMPQADESTIVSNKLNIDGKFFQVVEVKIEGQEVLAAKRFGYKLDKMTNGETFVSFHDDASMTFKELIQRKSEEAVSFICHAFPHKAQYYTPCNYSSRDGFCQGGYMNTDGSVCPSCNGTGETHHTSGQSVMKIPVELDGEKPMITPKDLIAYIAPDLNTLKYQGDNVEQLKKQVQKDVLGVVLEDRPSTPTTATQVRSIEDTTYDVLTMFAQGYADHFTFSVKAIAEILQIPKDGLTVDIAFPNDFELKSVGELLGEREAAIKAKAPYIIIRNLDMKIMRKQNKDNIPLIIATERVQDRVPYKHLEMNLAFAEATTLPTTSPDRVLFFNADRIVADILHNYPMFAMSNDIAQQNRIIDLIVAGYIQEIVERERINSISSVSREQLNQEIDGQEEEAEEE